MSTLPSWINARMRQKIIRSPVNPLDKSTVVSIFPRDVKYENHTIQPGKFFIPKGSFSNPSTLVVGGSSWWKEMDYDQHDLEIPQSSLQVADSIVKDYCNGLLACNMGDCMPGLFYIPGDNSVERIKTEFQGLLIKAKVVQDKWFQELVKMADVDWARTNGNPLSISDLSRIAVQELQLKDKAWMRDFNTLEMKNCQFCGHLIRPAFPLCPNCNKVVNQELFDKLNSQTK